MNHYTQKIARLTEKRDSDLAKIDGDANLSDWEKYRRKEEIKDEYLADLRPLEEREYLSDIAPAFAYS